MDRDSLTVKRPGAGELMPSFRRHLREGLDKSGSKVIEIVVPSRPPNRQRLTGGSWGEGGRGDLAAERPPRLADRSLVPSVSPSVPQHHRLEHGGVLRRKLTLGPRYGLNQHCVGFGRTSRLKDVAD